MVDDVEALSTIVNVLKQLDPTAQSRVLQSVQTFLGLPKPHAQVMEKIDSYGSGGVPSSRFSDERALSPKQFLRDKQPVTDVERVTCLAYYLAHYQDTPHFKTVDISTLNTEAAQPKFSNASVAVDNARAAGYLVPATKGNKQISATGEKFVELLPDREAAREAVRSFRPRKSSKKPNGNRGTKAK